MSYRCCVRHVCYCNAFRAIAATVLTEEDVSCFVGFEEWCEGREVRGEGAASGDLGQRNERFVFDFGEDAALGGCTEEGRESVVEVRGGFGNLGVSEWCEKE